MKHVSTPVSAFLVDVSPSAPPQHRHALDTLLRLQGEAVAELAGLVAMRLRGDSMAPTFRDGDFAVIDTSDIDASAGGVFAIAENGSVIISQVEIVHQSGRSTRRIRCTPRNPNYSPFELTIDEDVAIVGRVVQKIARL